VCAVFALAGAAHAAPIIIFNTGVDAAGIPLPDGTRPDPNYVLTAVPTGSMDTLVRTSAGGYPIPPWIGDDPISTWIGPYNSPFLNGQLGLYHFRTTFDLTGLNPATAVLTGQWATDDIGDIWLNGALMTGNSSLTWSTWYPILITTGFIDGVNTLDFVVNNTVLSYIGLRVEISGTADTPEPASLVLLAVGLAALTALRRHLV
jgi:hypothetical protein